MNSDIDKYSGDNLCSIASGFVKERAGKIGPYTENEFQRRFEDIERRADEISHYINVKGPDVGIGRGPQIKKYVISEHIKAVLETVEQLRTLANDYNSFVLPFQNPEIYEWIKDNSIRERIHNTENLIHNFMHIMKKYMIEFGGTNCLYDKAHLDKTLRECDIFLDSCKPIDEMSDIEKEYTYDNADKLCLRLRRIANSMDKKNTAYNVKYGIGVDYKYDKEYGTCLDYYRKHVEAARILVAKQREKIPFKSLADFTESDWYEIIHPKREYICPINNIFED